MNTLTALFEKSASQFSANSLVWEKKDGVFQSANYADAQVFVNQLASGLLSLGFEPTDKAILYSEGRTWWLLSELAIIACGGVSVPVSIRIEEPEELLFRIQHSDSKFIVVSARFLDMIRQVKSQFNLTQKIIIIDLPVRPDVEKREGEYFISELLETGKIDLVENQKKLEAIAAAASCDDVVNICYTSGTTADPKGIMLTHDNYMANVKQATAMMEVTPDFVTLLMLPWDHSFAHTVGLYSLIYKGAALAAVDGGKSAVEALRNVPVNIKEIKPVFLLSVPALAKNFKANIEKGIYDKGAIARMLFRFFKSASISYHGLGYNRGRGLRSLLKPCVWLGDKILFSKIRANFGGRLRYFIGGGALLDTDIQKFFNAIGIPMYQGYGLSEAAPVISTNGEGKFKMGSSGKVVPDLELVIADDDGNPLPIGQSGEILVKGRNVMKGYWKNEKASAEALQNGFLHTGDLGYVDQDGFLYVKGRFKSLLIANDGEKYSPESLEEALVFHSGIIEQIYLHNNQNPFTTALVFLNHEKLKKKLLAAGIDPKAEGAMHKVLDMVTHDINKLRFDTVLSRQYPSRWLPSLFCILEEGFNEKNHLLNSTMKIVRPKIESVHQPLFDMMYSAEGKKKTGEYNIALLEKTFE